MRRTVYASALALTLTALSLSAVAQARRGTTPARTGGTTTTATRTKPLAVESVPLPASDALLAVDLDKLFKEVVPHALAGNAERMAQVNADVEQFKTRTGLDARAFDRLVIGARIKRLDSGAVKLDNVAAIARGTVNPATLGASIRAASKGAVTEQQYGGKTIYVTTINDQIKLFGIAKMRVSQLAVVALDSETVALGEPEDVRATIDAQAGRAPRADAALLSFPKGPNDFIGFAGNVPAGTFADVETGLPGLDKAIASIQGFYGSVGSTTAGAQFAATLRAGTAADAKQLFDSLDAVRQMAPALIAIAGDKGKFAQGAINSLKVTTKGNEVQLHFDVPQSDIAGFLRML